MGNRPDSPIAMRVASESMKPRLLEHLVCPLDRTSLELHEWEGVEQPLTSEQCARAERQGIDPSALAREIVTGVLVNRSRESFIRFIKAFRDC